MCKTIYYLPEKNFECKNADGSKAFGMLVPIGGIPVFVIHPDSEQELLHATEEAGFIPVKFDYYKHACKAIFPVIPSLVNEKF